MKFEKIEFATETFSFKIPTKLSKVGNVWQEGEKKKKYSLSQVVAPLTCLVSVALFFPSDAMS